MTGINRRNLLASSAALVMLPLQQAKAQASPLSLLTAAKGSAFLPYGESLAKVWAASGLTVEVRESKGSTENLSTVEAGANALGLAFLGSAHEALSGIGPFAGKRHLNVRALLPMYDTSFQLISLPEKGQPVTFRALDGRKVGIGPAGGPAEGYFKGLAEEAGIKPVLVAGSATELSAKLLSGEIDALWQGASIPIPAFSQIANANNARVFGLTETEVALALKRFPFLSPSLTPAGAYKGQSEPIRSVSAWNVVIAHKDLPEAQAYALTKAILAASDLVGVVGPAARSTSAANAAVNTVVPYHKGAARYLAEAGVTVKSE
ncbi:MAG: TAXI family TRAP transporter solute-binding subunit [Bosea sp. (in: a-proteobacteria)]